MRVGKGTVHNIFLVGGITLITLFYVWTRLQNIRINREVAQLLNLEQKVNLENGKLRIKWTALTSPPNLEGIALSKFNLVKPKPRQIIFTVEPK